MPDNTDRFELQIWDDGDVGWEYTDTVKTVDELAIERGPIAERPNTGDYDDELYLAIDQRTLWRWDDAESDWKAVSGLGSDDSPVPGTSHFESVEADEIDSAPYRIDNTGSIILEDSVSDLIANLSEGDYAFIPAGSYDPITINADYVTIQCAGKRLTSFDDQDGVAVTISGRCVTMRGWRVRSSGSDDTNHGLLLDGADCTIADVILNMQGSENNANGIRVRSDRNNIGPINGISSAGDAIVFESGAEDNIVDQYTNAATITDNDGSNVIGETT